jgi:carboxyl-terminal processing protease
MKYHHFLLCTVLTGCFWLNAQALTINDLPGSDPQNTAVRSVIEQNSMSLDSQNNFRPNEPINKAAFLKAAFSYLGYKPLAILNNQTGFLDVPEESWFAPYVKRALEARIVSNTGNTLFYPATSITRQDGLLMLLPLYGIPTPLTQPQQDDLFDDIRPTRIYSYIYKVAKAKNISFSIDENLFRPSKTLTRADAAELLYKTKKAQGGAIITVEPVTTTPSISPELENNSTYSIFLDTWDRINNQFVYQKDLDQNQMIYGAISGMVDSLNDPYSSFHSPSQLGESYIYIPADYEGIGAVIELIENQYIVQTTLNNSPAMKAGLKSGDIILEIDSHQLEGLDPDSVTTLIKGKAGTVVNLKIKRDSQTLYFNITREKIDLKSINGKIINNTIVYLQIDQFTQDTYTEFEDQIKTLELSKYSKLIIDLRNNPGGYLSTTQQILNHFLEKDKVTFFTQDSQEMVTPYTSEGPGELKNLKIVILINEGSASASEILTAALKDNRQAKVVGTNSFGKGCIQEIIDYDDNSSLKLTIAKWLTPNKVDISGSGIAPDVKVELTQTDQQKNLDPQLDRAVTEVSNM